MTKAEIEATLLKKFEDLFEITDPDPDVNLGEAYEFDSIDAIELLGEIETLLGTELTLAEKKAAMEIRTFRQIVAYTDSIARARDAEEA